MLFRSDGQPLLRGRVAIPRWGGGAGGRSAMDWKAGGGLSSLCMIPTGVWGSAMRRVRAAACRMRIVGPNRHSRSFAPHPTLLSNSRKETRTIVNVSLVNDVRRENHSLFSPPLCLEQALGTGAGRYEYRRETSHRHAAPLPRFSSLVICLPGHAPPRSTPSRSWRCLTAPCL